MPLIHTTRLRGRLPESPAYAQLDLSLPLFSKNFIAFINGVVYTNSVPTGRPPDSIQPDRSGGPNWMAHGTAGSRSQSNKIADLFTAMPKTVLIGQGTADLRSIKGLNAFTGGYTVGQCEAGTNGVQLYLGADFTIGTNGYRSARGTAIGSPRCACFRVGTYTGSDWDAYADGSQITLGYLGSAGAYSASGYYLQTGWVNYAGGIYSNAYSPYLILAEADISADLASKLSANPFMVFKRESLPILIPASSGAYSASQSESITLADSVSVTVTMLGAMAEQITLADTPAAAMNAAAAMSEAVSLVDTITLTPTLAGAIAESITLTDTPAAVMTATGTISESIGLADTVSGAVGAFSVSISESITLADTLSAVMTATAAVSEALSLADTPSVVLTASRAVAESIALADTVAGGTALTASVVEALSLAELVGAVVGSVVYARGRPITGRAFDLRTITESRPVSVETRRRPQQRE